MDDDSEVCLGLGLGLGLSEYAPKRDNPRKNNKRVIFLDLGTPVHSSDYRFGTGSGSGSGSSLKIVGERDDKHDSRSNSFSTGNNSRDSSRRKLRLTTEQITLLEESFKQHSTLNIIQKQALAEKLKIKPRQVEVWFQNRRARTKQKQTEVDCKFLTKKCEKLSEENKRLKRELLELRSAMSVKNRPPQPPPQASVSQPMPQFFYHIPEVVPITPCEKIGRARGSVVKKEGVEAATTEVVHGPKP